MLQELNNILVNLNKNVNLVEIHNVKRDETGLLDSCIYSVSNPKPSVQPSVSAENTIEYVNNDLIYVYDKKDDGQKLYRKLLVDTYEVQLEHSILLVCAFNEEILPIYRFPCTSDITLKRSFYKKNQKINNRVSIVTENSIQFVSYKHCDNVDLKLMTADITKSVKMILST